MTVFENNIMQLSDFFIKTFPVMNELEQQTALTLYRLLALGKPVSCNLLAKSVNHTTADIEELINSWSGIFYDDDNNVIGFLGLTVNETPHHMIINDVTVYTWCAWDALFIPELLDTTVKVKSTCPVTNEDIELIVSPTFVKTLNNNDIVVSFLKPELENLDNITTSFCHFVHFFPNKAVGNQWCAENKDTFLLSLNYAFLVGKKINAARYKQTLHSKG